MSEHMRPMTTAEIDVEDEGFDCGISGGLASECPYEGTLKRFWNQGWSDGHHMRHPDPDGADH